MDGLEAAYAAKYGRLAGDVATVARPGDGMVHIAARSGHVLVLAQLLAAGSEVSLSERNARGATPLYLACQEGHVDLARMLLEHGASVNQRTDAIHPNGTDSFRATPLFMAC